MIFRFDNFCEAWAAAYRPISHIPSKDGRNARFFRHDTPEQFEEVCKRLVQPDKCDLFMTVVTQYDGELVRESENSSAPNFYSWHRHVLFWSHQAPAARSVVPNDEEAAADAKSLAIQTAEDFIAFLQMCVNPKDKEHYIDDLRGINFDSIEVLTLPRAFDGWWIAVINFEHDMPRKKCVIDEQYNMDVFNEYGSFFSKNRFHH